MLWPGLKKKSALATGVHTSISPQLSLYYYPPSQIHKKAARAAVPSFSPNCADRTTTVHRSSPPGTRLTPPFLDPGGGHPLLSPWQLATVPLLLPGSVSPRGRRVELIPSFVGKAAFALLPRIVPSAAQSPRSRSLQISVPGTGHILVHLLLLAYFCSKLYQSTNFSRLFQQIRILRHCLC